MGVYTACLVLLGLPNGGGGRPLLLQHVAHFLAPLMPHAGLPRWVRTDHVAGSCCCRSVYRQDQALGLSDALRPQPRGFGLGDGADDLDL